MTYDFEAIRKNLKNPYVIGAVGAGAGILIYSLFSRKSASESVTTEYSGYPQPEQTPEMTYPTGGGSAQVTPDITSLLEALQSQQEEAIKSMTETMNQNIADLTTTLAENISDIRQNISSSVEKATTKRRRTSKSSEIRISDIEKELSKTDEIARSILEAKKTYIEAEKRYLAGDKSALKQMEAAHQKAESVRKSFGISKNDPLLGNVRETYIGSYKGSYAYLKNK